MLKQLTIAGLEEYQAKISPILKREGYTCVYSPTCSEYALNTLKTHHFVIAISLILFRLLSCNPINAYLKKQRMEVIT